MVVTSGFVPFILTSFSNYVDTKNRQILPEVCSPSDRKVVIALVLPLTLGSAGVWTDLGPCAGRVAASTAAVQSNAVSSKATSVKAVSATRATASARATSSSANIVNTESTTAPKRPQESTAKGGSKNVTETSASAKLGARKYSRFFRF